VRRKAIERDAAPLFQVVMWDVTTLRACRKVSKRDIALLL
jgi:hypothetical protein